MESTMNLEDLIERLEKIKEEKGDLTVEKEPDLVFRFEESDTHLRL